MLNKTEKLKDIILNNYSSIREFARIVGIPSTTLTSALDKDIGGMAVDRVIKICEVLNIDIKTFEPLENDCTAVVYDAMERKLLKNFNMLNDSGKEKVISNAHDLTQIDKYTMVKLEKEEEPKRINLKEELDRLNEEQPIETIAAHNDHWDEPGEMDKMLRDIERIKQLKKSEK